ncbi:hypothetical protein [Streptomyces sp. NRRL F-5135]|uniref:hypothetical protein n=1 Tax=Streptomyces sp. NRRL F-5135 TaxID=1463858 RepID=UPI00056B52DE|nr:hypothetical protein [Streptomyces sp. NRRL F-5135]
MSTAPPQVNGHQRPAMPIYGEWRPTDPQATPTPPREPKPAEPAVDHVALAEAAAIRERAAAEAEERRIKAEAEAEAVLIKAAEEARKLKLANDKAEARAAEEQAARNARIAESNRKQKEAERQEAAARKAEEEQQKADAASAEAIAKAASNWRRYAITFYAVCAVVALPVQIAAFWDPKAWWLVIAPLMLEGAALVVTKGAAAAVAAHRPHWHYRLVSWLFAFIAAGINLWHGLAAFDPATAIGTAFASIAGPGVWDLHEHGRIRKRDGVPTRRERRAAAKAAKAEAAEKAAAKLFEAERQAHLENAARDAVKQLDEARASQFPEVHRHALKLAADLGEKVITEAIWKRAKRDVEGADPGESAETIRMRNAAEMRVEAARQKKPVSALSKTKNAQLGIQTPRSGYRPVPPVRKPKDTPPYHRAAGRAHGELLRRSTAAKKTSAEEPK